VSHDDFDFEPVRGLPEILPEGERILWQGGPRWRALACHVFHWRIVSGYFAIVIAWRLWAGWQQDVPLTELATSTLAPLGLALLVIGFLGLVAWAYGKTTVYTVTDRRVVIRSGVAFQVTFNIPFKTIRNAGLKTFGNGTGNITLELDGSAHIAYLHIWPNARPWFLSKVQPLLRHVDQPQAVAKTLSNALKAYHGAEAAASHRARGAVADRALSPLPALEAAE